MRIFFRKNNYARSRKKRSEKSKLMQKVLMSFKIENPRSKLSFSLIFEFFDVKQNKIHKISHLPLHNFNTFGQKNEKHFSM